MPSYNCIIVKYALGLEKKRYFQRGNMQFFAFIGGGLLNLHTPYEVFTHDVKENTLKGL